MPTLPDLNWLQPLLDLGTSGLLLVFIALLTRRTFVTGKELDQERSDCASEKAELRTDRDEWKTIAKEAVDSMDRIAVLLEARR